MSAGPPERSASWGERPAVFVDRDGTLMVDRDYLADPEGVELVPGAAEAIRRLHAAGYAVVVVTNQSGIARGLYTEDDYRAVAARLDEVLAAEDASPDATRYCPHHADFTGPCDCRKPATGMHRAAARELGLDPAASWYVGDKATDVLPARELGGRGILVRTGWGEEEVERVGRDVHVVADVAAAVDLILREDGDGG